MWNAENAKGGVIGEYLLRPSGDPTIACMAEPCLGGGPFTAGQLDAGTWASPPRGECEHDGKHGEGGGGQCEEWRLWEGCEGCEECGGSGLDLDDWWREGPWSGQDEWLSAW
jgi:hypothetical protein